MVLLADQLLQCLLLRDQRIQASAWGDKIAMVDELKGEMDQIKILCIVTHIYEITRMLSNDDKAKLKQYCDQVIRKK